MKNWLKKVVLVAALASSTGHLAQAQDDRGQGRRDPEEMRQRMMERLREQMEVKDDGEWKIIEGKVQKVNEARRQTGGMGFAGMAGRRGGPGGPGGQGGDRPPEGGGNRRGFGGEPSPEMEDLRKAIDSKGSSEDIKAKLAKVREVRKANEAKLETAQEDLRKVLTVRQEAVAVMNGLLK